jgi:hypothetical protein
MARPNSTGRVNTERKRGKRPVSAPGHGGTYPGEPLRLAGNLRNPRTRTDERLSALRNALAEFGDLGGIVFNRKSGQLVGGHQRTKVFAADKGARVIITDKLPTPDKWGTVALGYVLLSDGNRFSYRQVDWEPTRETAAMLAANRHGGEFDESQVNVLLSELDEAGFDLRLTGFGEASMTRSSNESEPTDLSGAIHERFEVVVECQDEVEQQKTFEQLTSEGKKCRLLTF